MIKKFEGLHMQKKADISVTLLVYMTIALCLIAMFVFSSYDSTFSKQIVGASNIQTFYFEEQGFEMYFQSLGEKVVSDIKAENKPITNEEFSKRFDFAIKTASENYFPLFNFNITSGTYEISQSGNIVDAELKGFIFTKFLVSNNPDITSISINKTVYLKIPLG